LSREGAKAVSRSKSTRRQFTKTLALLAATPLAASPGEAPADEPKPPKPQGPAAVAEALVEVARLRHGKHLTEEQLQSLQRGLLFAVLAGERLKQVPLKNSDEPAFTFSADLP
jgi:predicted secreted protein